MTVCLRDAERDVCEIPIVCAVTDLRAAEYDVILPADVVRELQATSVAVNVPSCDVNAVCDVGTETNDPEVEYNAPEDVDSLPVSEVEADTTALVMEQEQEPSLANCWIQEQPVRVVSLPIRVCCTTRTRWKVRQSVSCVCPRVAGLISCSWPMSQCLEGTWASVRPGKGSDYPFTGRGYVRLRCLTFSRVVFVNYVCVQ